MAGIARGFRRAVPFRSAPTAGRTPSSVPARGSPQDVAARPQSPGDAGARLRHPLRRQPVAPADPLGPTGGVGGVHAIPLSAVMRSSVALVTAVRTAAAGPARAARTCSLQERPDPSATRQVSVPVRNSSKSVPVIVEAADRQGLVSFIGVGDRLRGADGALGHRRRGAERGVTRARPARRRRVPR